MSGRYAVRAVEPDVSVVVTLLNERHSLDELYRRTTAALDGRSFELILVDDGSTDGTWEEVARLHEADPRVHGADSVPSRHGTTLDAWAASR